MPGLIAAALAVPIDHDSTIDARGFCVSAARDQNNVGYHYQSGGLRVGQRYAFNANDDPRKQSTNVTIQVRNPPLGQRMRI